MNTTPALGALGGAACKINLRKVMVSIGNSSAIFDAQPISSSGLTRLLKNLSVELGATKQVDMRDGLTHGRR